MNKFQIILVISALLGLSSAATVEKRPKHTIDFDHYWTLAEIEDYMHDLTLDFPSLASLEEFGHTANDEHIEALVVRKGSPKATVVIEAGLRGREWISTMAALYFIHEIVEHSESYSDILDKVDLVFFPTANPDGYEYSHVSDRTWIKNRRAVSSSCFGVDLNRNFGYQFHGTSDPCDSHYTGPYAFSEEETKAIQRVLTTYGSSVKMFLSIQANGPQVLIPYNYIALGSSSQTTLRSLAGQVSTVMQNVNGRTYAIGVAGEIAGLEAGTPLDYAYESARVPLTFSLRLPSTGNDIAGSQLPSYLTEAFRGFLVFARHVASQS